MAIIGRTLALRLAVSVVLVISIVWISYAWISRQDRPEDAAGARLLTTEPGQDAGVTAVPPPTVAKDDDTPPPPEADDPIETTSRQAAAAAADYRRGVTLSSEGDLIGARGALGAALATGLLGPQAATDCRKRLASIAEEVLFSLQVYRQDPYARSYTVKPGDTLTGIVKREKLLVPYECIKRINRITNDRTLRAGQKIKLVQGPFDVVVTKRSFTLDLYHHGTFVKSYRIGLGQNGSTPEGKWIVRSGGRVREAPWTPPAGADGRQTIECGQPGYPLGKEGLWIALQGAEKKTEMFAGFGIHGTDEPDTIGRQASRGCIRLGDANISELFDMVCAGKSKVLVMP